MILWQIIQVALFITEICFALLYTYMLVKVRKAERRSGITVPPVWHVIAVFNCLFIITSIIFICILRFT